MFLGVGVAEVGAVGVGVASVGAVGGVGEDSVHHDTTRTVAGTSLEVQHARSNALLGACRSAQGGRGPMRPT